MSMMRSTALSRSSNNASGSDGVGLYFFPVANSYKMATPSSCPLANRMSSTMMSVFLVGSYIQLWSRRIAMTLIPVSVSRRKSPSDLSVRGDVLSTATRVTVSSASGIAAFSSWGRPNLLSTIFAMSPAALDIFSAAEATCRTPESPSASSTPLAPSIAAMLA